jgi:hypothetical protein
MSRSVEDIPIGLCLAKEDYHGEVELRQCPVKRTTYDRLLGQQRIFARCTASVTIPKCTFVQRDGTQDVSKGTKQLDPYVRAKQITIDTIHAATGEPCEYGCLPINGRLDGYEPGERRLIRPLDDWYHVRVAMPGGQQMDTQPPAIRRTSWRPEWMRTAVDAIHSSLA